MKRFFSIAMLLFAYQTTDTISSRMPVYAGVLASGATFYGDIVYNLGVGKCSKAMGSCFVLLVNKITLMAKDRVDITLLSKFVDGAYENAPALFFKTSDCMLCMLVVYLYFAKYTAESRFKKARDLFSRYEDHPIVLCEYPGACTPNEIVALLSRYLRGIEYVDAYRVLDAMRMELQKTVMLLLSAAKDCKKDGNCMLGERVNTLLQQAESALRKCTIAQTIIGRSGQTIIDERILQTQEEQAHATTISARAQERTSWTIVFNAIARLFGFKQSTD